MDAALANRLAASVRAADPDRYFATLFAPATLRPLLLTLYAFNHEVARVAETVREPMLGAIRLEWWRETVEGAFRGMPRNHDVARGLTELAATGKVTLGDFEAAIAARAFDASAERFADFAALEAHIDATGGTIMRLAIAILGGDPALAREPALAYGLAGLVRSLPFHNARHKLYFPEDLLAALNVTAEEFFQLDPDAGKDQRMNAATRQVALRARDHFLAARRGPKPRAAMPAILPAALVPVTLRKFNRAIPTHRKQMALLAAAMKKRL